MSRSTTTARCSPPPEPTARPRIWDPATGEELHSVQVPGYERRLGVWGPSFSPDGSLFAAAWPVDGLVKIVDLATGQIVREVRSVRGPKDTSFDPTGARLAIASWFAPLAQVVDVASGDDVFTLEGHRRGIHEIAWSPDGESIATASHRRQCPYLRRAHRTPTLRAPRPRHRRVQPRLEP